MDSSHLMTASAESVTVELAPVAIFIFNRPELTKQLLVALAEIKPPRLLVVCDGPRPDRAGEAEVVAAVRALIETTVDWPCDISYNYVESNMGCRKRMASGITWVFEQVERAILLEDDCIPDPSFFRFASELLERYADREEVMSISGCMFPDAESPMTASYRATRWALIWGWATWRRAWARYDVEMTDYGQLRTQDWAKRHIPIAACRAYWYGRFERAFAGRVDTWDFAWLFTCWKHGGLCLTPKVNMIRNIGFGDDATHTMNPDHELAKLASTAMEFPLTHPDQLRVDQAYDRRFGLRWYRGTWKARWRIWSRRQRLRIKRCFSSTGT